jgi:hypothetical protein
MDYRLYTNIAGMGFAIIFAGIITIFITTGSTGENSLNALRIGYMAILLSLLLICVLLMFDQYYKKQQPYYILNLGFPFIFMAATIFILLSILGSNFERIADSKTSDYYLSFSVVFTLILIVQLYVLFNSILTKEFKDTMILPGKSYYMVILLGVINSIVVIILGIILKYYVTDG